ncbi:MAG: VOC family protein [Dehalococcoidia bacterium]|nr:VOC family protein [Dehalococcoidia bacterium]
MAAQDGADIEGVAGVIVWTDQYPEMLAFYRDVLGLAPRSERPTFANFEWGGFRLSVAAHDEVHGPARDPLRIMVHFKVPDIAAAHRRLTDRGVAFSRPPEQERWGGWVATFADPDGNTLQLLQLPD